MIFPKPSRLSLKALDRKLWRLVSEFVRRRDASLQTPGGALIANCITCGKPDFWKNMDAGHFISRNKKATRFDLKNINAQCRACNRFQSGNQFEHGQAIDRKWGAGTAEALLLKSKQACKRGRADYLVLIQECQDKLKAMRGPLATHE